MAQWNLYYDGGCNLCHASQIAIEKWAQRAGQPLKVDILLSDEAIAKGYGEAMVLEVDGKPLYAADAWLETMKIAPLHLRWISSVCQIPICKKIAHAAYGVVAKYRLKWFGSRICDVPPKSL